MQPIPLTDLGMIVRLNANFEDVLARTIEALKSEGFGIITEIDFKETLKQKLNVDFRPYKILGACNPQLSYRALSATPEIGLLLPCNVTVAYIEDLVTEVSVVNPVTLLGFVKRPELVSIATEVYERVHRVTLKLTAHNENAL